MKYNKLGNTDIKVSRICLGTMTFGEQNTEAEAHEQLNYAVAKGINFIDTAEMYPVPPKADTYTRTESYIGTWLKQQKREDLVVASKIAGPSRAGDDQNYIRGGSRFTEKQIIEACEASLKRLKTEYLDLYQLHWPERSVNFFGKLGVSELNDNSNITALEETLGALQKLQQQGKIRHFGLSNETPWGVSECLRLHREQNLPLVASIQNPYSLLNRSFEIGLSEFALRTSVGLLAYSPLAFGVLTGKYQQQPWPKNSRLALFSRFTRYSKAHAFAAVDRYQKIADKAGISLTHLALSFVNQQAFVSSNIIGATTMEQLRENIASIDVTLSPDTIAAINEVHAEISNPCP